MYFVLHRKENLVCFLKCVDRPILTTEKNVGKRYFVSETIIIIIIRNRCGKRVTVLSKRSSPLRTKLSATP